MDSHARSALAVFAIAVSVIYDLLPADMPTHSPNFNYWPETEPRRARDRISKLRLPASPISPHHPGGGLDFPCNLDWTRIACPSPAAALPPPAIATLSTTISDYFPSSLSWNPTRGVSLEPSDQEIAAAADVALASEALMQVSVGIQRP